MNLIKKDFCKSILSIGIIILLTTQNISALRISSPKKISEIFQDVAVGRVIKNILSKSSLDSLVTQDELNNIEVFAQPINDKFLYPISNIEGIQYLNNLKQLTISGGEISDISVLSSLLNLSVITLPHNKVENLTPLYRLKKLTHLDFSFSQIKHLEPLSNLNNLIWIEMPGNNISDLLPLKSLKKLKTLNLTGNPIQGTQLSVLQTTKIFYTNPQTHLEEIIDNTSIAPEIKPNICDRLLGWLFGKPSERRAHNQNGVGYIELKGITD